MKTFLTLVIATLAFTPLAKAQQAAAFIVADGTSGYVLNAQNENRKLQVGSLTKVATAMVVLDWAERTGTDLSQRANVPSSISRVGGSNFVGFQPGDQVTLRDLLYAMLLQSDNKAAYVLANHVGRTFLNREKAEVHPVDLFVAQMNALARRLGMERTRFLNPHGLDNEEQPYSTAKDLVALANYAMQRSAFRFYVSQKGRLITRYLADGSVAKYQLANTNALLGAHDIDGVKTGRTNRAGDCLIISAAKPPESILNADGSHTITPRRLMVVVLGAQDRFGQAERLLVNGWRDYSNWAAAGRPVNKR